MTNVFFDSWESIWRTAFLTLMSYVLMIMLLRRSGKRTLSKMNAFDMIITIALGSTLATVTLSKDVALADGATVFFLLIALQYVITTLSVRFKWFSRLVKSTPSLLVYKGELFRGQLQKERIAEDEIYAIIREKGLVTLDEVEAIVLETDGSMTVMGNVPSLRNQVMGLVSKPADMKNV